MYHISAKQETYAIPLNKMEQIFIFQLIVVAFLGL